MKKIITLSAMCATLVAVSSCGGEAKNEPVEPVEEATAWSDIVAFDTNGEATGSEVFNYGQDGKVVSVDKFTVDKADKKKVQTDYIIYANGKPSFGKSFRPDGTVDGRDLFTYNEKGLLQEEVIETYSEGLKRVAPSMRYVYEYNENGDVTSIKEQKAMPKGWATEYEWTYSYDAQGRLTGRADFTGDGKERKQGCMYSWVYEDGSNKIKQLDYFTYDLKLGKLKHDSKTEYNYDADGRVKTALVYRHKANKKRDEIKSRRFTYEYNAAGQLTLIFEQKWNNGASDWYEVSSVTREYDAAGQITKQTTVKNTNKGTKFYNEVHAQGAPADKPNVAQAAPTYNVKPEINLDDKHKTSMEED